MPRDEIVFSHNDVQENNILVFNENNELITLIDFEYGGWNPIAYDLANYLNEMCTDNAHPTAPGIKLYLSNFPTQEEVL